MTEARLEPGRAESGRPESEMERWAHPAMILVATNLSDLDRLMPHAMSMAQDSGARLLLLHVLPATASLTVDVTGMPYYDPASAMEYARKALEQWCLASRDRGLTCDGIVREGHAAREIVVSIRQFKADRLILGTRSRSKLGKLLLGSVAEQVLRSVNLPVITVGPEAHLPVDDRNHGKTVLYATTLGETSRPGAALACQIAAGQGARLLLLHVLPPSGKMERAGLPASLDSTAVRELRRLAQETGAGCCSEVEAKVLHGHPAIEILAEAAASHASLIVLSAVHHSAFQDLTRDHTIYRVLAHAHCPVLTLRQAAPHPALAEAEALAAHR